MVVHTLKENKQRKEIGVSRCCNLLGELYEIVILEVNMVDDWKFHVIQSTSVSYCCKTHYHKLSIPGQKCSECKDPEALVCLD